MQKMSFITVAVFILFVWMGCQFKKEVTAYPNSSNCDTSNVRYSVEIENIMVTHCYVCHSTASANSIGGGNKFDTYATLKTYADNNLLLNTILRIPGFSQMPKNAPKLSDCDIAKVRIWIQKGAPNN